MLEEATGKLDLPSAGRRIFLPDGTLVTFAHQLYKDCSVYISMGEPFKDPCEVLRGLWVVMIIISITFIIFLMLVDYKRFLNFKSIMHINYPLSSTLATV